MRHREHGIRFVKVRSVCGSSVRKMAAVSVCTALLTALLSSFDAMDVLAAAAKTFTLSQAQNMALADNPQIRKKYNEILLKQMKYQDAVRSVNEKRRNLTTFRWSPLLKFHFPEKLNLSEEMEFVFKPLTIQTDIRKLQHELDDMRFEILSKVNTTYSDCYYYQEKVRDTERILKDARRELKKNSYRLALGKASRSDIDAMEKFIATKESDLSLLKRSFETSKGRLTELVRMDVSTRYTFRNPYQTADIPREQLEAVTSYTLEHSQDYFEASVTAALDLNNLDTARMLMGSRYGGTMNWISPYVTGARQGKEVDTAAFQIAYNQMLNDVDSPWWGKKRILFIRIPKEWFKGQIDGIRYVEDEPYALFNACLDYLSSYREKADVEKEIRNQVYADFEALVTAKNAYDTAKTRTKELQAELDRLQALNKLGDAGYEEVSDKRTDFQEAQMDVLSALKDYNDLLYAYDRLTTGAVTAFMRGEDLEFSSGGIANSLVGVDEEDIPYYTIGTRTRDMEFVFSIHVPDEFEPAISDFELWYGDLRIGERTPVEKQIVHLSVAGKNDENRFTVRLFHEGKFIGQCEIDPTILRDRLILQTAVPVKKETGKEVGAYLVSLNQELGLATMSLTVEELPDAKYYTLHGPDGGAVYRSEPRKLGESFTYLSVLAGDLSQATLRFYDAKKEFLCECEFDTNRLKIVKKGVEKTGE